MGTATTRLMMQACHAIAAEKGAGPNSDMLVTQRISRWRDEGRVTTAQINEVIALLERAEDKGIPDEEAIVAELKPVVQRRLQKDAVQAAVQGYAAKDDLTKIAKLIDKAARLGDTNLSAGIILGEDSWDAITDMNLSKRLATGVSDLDVVLDGGLGRGQLGVAVGGPGDGKSMFLNHVACEAYLAGRNVAYLTLELPEPLVLSRIKANLVEVPEKEIRSGQSMDKVRDRFKRMLAYYEQTGAPVGTISVHYMTPHATTVQDVKEWVTLVEERTGKPLDLLVVDYADKLAAKKDSEYEAMRVVYEGLRHFAVEKGLWCWTASQSVRQKEMKKDGVKPKGINDLADSQHKARAADLVITLNASDNATMMSFFVAKNRTSDSQMTVGPVPADFRYGRICAVKRGE